MALDPADRVFDTRFEMYRRGREQSLSTLVDLDSFAAPEGCMLPSLIRNGVRLLPAVALGRTRAIG